MTSRSRLLFRLGVGALLALPAWPYGHFLLALARSESVELRWYNWSFLISEYSIALAAAGLAVALLWRAVDRPDARVFALCLAFLVYIPSADAGSHLRRFHGLPYLLDRLVDLAVPMGGAGALVALLHFSFLFPRPLTAQEVRQDALAGKLRARFMGGSGPWKALVGLLASLIIVPELAFASARWWGTPRINLFTFIMPPGTVIALLMMAAAAANLRTGYGVADAQGRRRIFWVLEGLFAGTSLLVLASVLKLAQMVTGYEVTVAGWYWLAIYLALLVALGCFAVAMFFAGAIDPALAIRRTAVIASVGFATLFIFVAVEQLVQEYLLRRLGISQQAGGFLTGVVVALTFDRVKAGVEHRLKMHSALPRADTPLAPGALAP